MIPAAPMVTDLALSVAALAGLLILHQTLVGRGRWDPLNRRFIFGIRVTILLFAARVLGPLTGLAAFDRVVLFAAALIPLSVLVLTEGLLRRHAPRWIKAPVAVGTVGFAVLALFPVTQGGLYALLGFQIAGLTAAGWLVLTREGESLSAAENRAAGRLGLSLLLLIPLAVADFLSTPLGFRPSGLGVLFLCWLALSLGRPEARHARALVTLALALAAGMVAGLLVALLWSASGPMRRGGWRSFWRPRCWPRLRRTRGHWRGRSRACRCCGCWPGGRGIARGSRRRWRNIRWSMGQ